MDEKAVIEAVQKIRPVKYKHKTDYQGIDMEVEHFGFIAQELEEIFPSEDYGVVTEDPNGIKMVRYHEVIPLLVKYVQYLEDRVQKLEKSVEEK